MDDQAARAGLRRTVTVGDHALALTEYAGDGPPLVLLHGIGSRDVSWWPVIAGLTPWFHLYALDLRGHGASAKPEAGYDVEDFADDLEGVLDALDLARPRIIGHSLGALVTLSWAARAPERAAAVVLEDPPLRVVAATLSLFDEWMQQAAMTVEEAAAVYQERFPAWTAEERLRRAESITGTAPGVFREGRDQFARLLAEHGEHLRPVSDKLPPTLLIHGDIEAGGLVAAADAEHFAAAAPSAEVVRIAGAGHTIHRDHSEAFLALVVPFLQRVAPTEPAQVRSSDEQQATTG